MIERLNRPPWIVNVVQKLTVPEFDLLRVEPLMQVLRKWVAIGSVVITTCVIINSVINPSQFVWIPMLLGFGLIVAMMGLRNLSQRGLISEVVNLLVAVIILYITFAVRPEFLTSGYMLAYALPVAAAALLLTPDAGWVWAVIATLIMWLRVMVAARNPDVVIGFGEAFVSIALFYLLTGLICFLSRSLEQSRVSLRRQIDLGRTGVELGHMVTSALDTPIIVRQAVQMIQEAFDYFQVALYSLDTESGSAVLVDAAGKDAEVLMEKGVRVPLSGRTVLAYSINQKQPQTLFSWKGIQDYMGRDIEFTHKRSIGRAELVIPLHMGDRVYGALDIHSTEMDAFSEGDIHTLKGIGGNIANALEGALHFEERMQAARELEKAYAEVEIKVEERTADLQHETAERERLQQEVIEAQERAIRDLTTPIIPVMDQIIVMPLIGSIDDVRARDMMRRLLMGISEQRARVVILDITGVPLVDTTVAGHLYRTIQAARLKGTRTIVTGMSDAVAETIVDLGIDWDRVETLRNLQTGLLVALEEIGLHITE
ncbi:MAG: STAS domain-containing protein [Chloroflexi bacterium]|nr:STAS domain-containing protein [Chloroflexota bacterium]